MPTNDDCHCYDPTGIAGKISAGQQGVGSYLTAAGDAPRHPHCCHLQTMNAVSTHDASQGVAPKAVQSTRPQDCPTSLGAHCATKHAQGMMLGCKQ